jgi:anti-sigma B factor antagonist
MRGVACLRGGRMILKIDRKRIEPDIALLEMTGRIVIGSDGMRVEWNVSDLIKENCKKVIFDMAGVTIVDSTGVGILVMCYAKLKKAGGTLRIAGVNGMVEETLQITSVDKLIESFPSVAQASQGF